MDRNPLSRTFLTDRFNDSSLVICREDLHDREQLSIRGIGMVQLQFITHKFASHFELSNRYRLYSCQKSKLVAAQIFFRKFHALYQVCERSNNPSMTFRGACCGRLHGATFAMALSLLAPKYCGKIVLRDHLRHYQSGLGVARSVTAEHRTRLHDLICRLELIKRHCLGDQECFFVRGTSWLKACFHGGTDLVTWKSILARCRNIMSLHAVPHAVVHPGLPLCQLHYLVEFMTIRVPSKKESGYWAGKKIHTTGPMLPVELYAFSEMGQKVSHRQTALESSIKGGWLVALPDGRIGLSETARERYDSEPVIEELAGQVATPRENVNAMKPLSRKHYLNAKGTRADAPDVRAYPSLYAKGRP